MSPPCYVRSSSGSARGWQGDNDSMDAVAHRIAALKEEGIEYIRLECNLGSALEIGGAAQLADNIHCSARLSRLAEVARSCARAKRWCR